MKMEQLIPPPNYRVIQTGDAKFHHKNSQYDKMEHYRLVRSILNIVNDQQQLQCYASGYGNLVIFQLPDKDVDYLNSLTYQLVRLANLRHGQVQYLQKDATAFFPHDRDTRIFNHYGEPVMKTEFINTFSGRVALQVKGLKVADKQQIYLETSVHQVKIDLEEEMMEAHRQSVCLFDSVLLIDF